jgi:hypothetical protein
MGNIDLWQLKTKAKTFYPESFHMQKQWLRTSVYLYTTGRHAVLTGGWRRV